MKDEWKKVPSRSRREDGVCWWRWWSRGGRRSNAGMGSIGVMREKVPGGEKRMDGFAFRRNDDDDEEEID